jgi:hypothetical protein
VCWEGLRQQYLNGPKADGGECRNWVEVVTGPSIDHRENGSAFGAARAQSRLFGEVGHGPGWSVRGLEPTAVSALLASSLRSALGAARPDSDVRRGADDWSSGGWSCFDRSLNPTATSALPARLSVTSATRTSVFPGGDPGGRTMLRNGKRIAGRQGV